MVDKFSESAKIVKGHPACLSALLYILSTMEDKASNTLLHASELTDVFRAQGKLATIKYLEDTFKNG
jgi:hypothetical protein